MREDWIEVELGEICSKITDGTHHTPTYINNGVHFISVKDIYNGVVNFEKTKFISKEVHFELTKRCNPELDDLLITKSGTIGRMALVPSNPEFSLFVSVALIKNKKEIIISKFLMYLLEDYLKSISISQVIKGGLLKNFHLEDIRKTVVKLAPLPIQRAIVSKIEALFSDLDNGIANFKKAQEQLKTYRQAVLKKAFEGELTKEWREKQSNLPTAEELLKQIKEERQKHYDQQIEDWKKAVKEWEKNGKVGKKPSKTTALKELPPLKKEELEELPKLPEEWAWCKNLNVSTKITDGEHITPKREQSGYYLLSARNIQNGYISYKNVDYVGEDEYLRIRKRCNPEFGDILISCSGSVGRISLVPKNDNFVMVRSVALVKTNSKILNPKFLEYLFLSPVLQSQIEDGKKATAQANLFLEPIGKLNVILCSTQEQTQIVQEIESRLSVTDNLEFVIRNSIEKAEALRQSILKKAFDGRLLSQAEIELCKKEADYEPASELLKKITNEKLRITNLKKKGTNGK